MLWLRVMSWLSLLYRALEEIKGQSSTDYTTYKTKAFMSGTLDGLVNTRALGKFRSLC